MSNSIETLDRNFSTLPSGKEVGIYKVANTSLYRIAFKQGGEVPKELDGMWTDPYKAQMAIKGYIMRREIEAKQRLEDAAKELEKKEVEAVVEMKTETKSTRKAKE